MNSRLIIIIGVGALLSVYYNTKRKQPVMGVVLGATGLYLGLSVVDSLSGQEKFVDALAYLYLVYCLLHNGASIITDFASFASGYKGVSASSGPMSSAVSAPKTGNKFARPI